MIYVIWYKGQHYAVSPIQGTSRMQLQHPTMDLCNPMKLECTSNYTDPGSLPYCDQYGKKPDSAPVQLPCEYFDSIELPVYHNGGLLLPTQIDTYMQKQIDGPTKWAFVDRDGNPQSEERSKGRAHATKKVFVTDLEDFTILIDHAFSSPALEIAHDDYEMQGYFLDCREPKEVEEEEKDTKERVKETIKENVGTERRNCKRRPILCSHERCKDWMKLHPEVKAEVQARAQAKAQASDAATSFAIRHGEHEERSSHGSMQGGLPSMEDVPIMHEKHIGGSEKHVKHKHHVMLNRREPQPMDDLPHPRKPPSRDMHLMDDVDDGHDVAFLQEMGVDLDSYTDDNPILSLERGDALPLGRLVELAGVHLDDLFYGRSRRARGMVIVINIHYSNQQKWMYPWTTLDPPEYTISVTKRPVYEFQLRKWAGQTPDGQARTFLEYHGVYMVIMQDGELVSFDFLHLFVVLSASLGLLKVASLVTDKVATNLISQKKECYDLKYEWSRDFYPDPPARVIN